MFLKNQIFDICTDKVAFTTEVKQVDIKSGQKKEDSNDKSNAFNYTAMPKGF